MEGLMVFSSDSESEDEAMENAIPPEETVEEPAETLSSDPELSIYELEGFKTNAHALAAEWIDAFNRGDLEKLDFREHLRLLVPKVIYRDTPEPTQSPLDEKAVATILLEPLQRFCFNNADPADFMKLAKASNEPSSICGHVFQIGEPTYTCRDCGLDPTCVLCVQCFNLSAHRSHRYKMSTSSGGGYCDCGDAEAWKQHEACTNHAPSKVTEDPGHSLPEQDAHRAKILFEFIVSYAMDLLTYEYSGDPPPRYSLTEDEVTQLQVKSVAKTYACILYNDESHTFELVIQTLTKALQTTKRQAVEYATAIDRDGRAIVKAGSFKECKAVKEIIERNTSRNGMSPLKTELLHGYVVAHQSVAACLLAWAREMVAISSGFRYVFYKVVTSVYRPEPGGLISRGNDTCLEILMASDTKFWKSVRVQWHHLFISGLLKEYYMKKEFAAAFGKLYADLMKDFIYDDHDHIYSISALSVQIFTVPTLAHFLIEKYDVFFTILRTFLSECESKLNDLGKVKFENTSSQFKRTHFAIMDLKYLLTTPPSVWNDGLRKQFLHGAHSFLKLLFWLQETDPVVRQSGAHVEFEPEWEAAFNTHIKLSPVIALLLDWCATDRSVCIKMYRMVLRCVASLKYPEQMKTIVRELADHSATCYIYDIASKPVSIHLALTRLFAGLYVLLETFNLTSFDSAVICDNSPAPEILMEPALRALCLSAQCHAGMWKRNGYSLMNQMYFYHNVRCRADMYDRDVVALQFGASVIESNEFLIHVLNRLGMWGWTDENYDEPSPDEDSNVGFTVLLAEEFFQLIITIVSARFSPGVGIVTAEDCVRKQIIQALCISPMQHSELNKLLVENVYGETGIEGVIKSVTKCKRTDKGDNYELLPEHYSEYDVFHHHYTREDMSKAEGKQRERMNEAKKPDFFPPPKLPFFTSNFMMVVNVLKSDVLLYMMSLVLKRSLKPNSRSLSEPQLRRVLHLIGIALNEEITRSEIEPEHFFQFTDAAKRWNIFGLFGEMLQNTRLTQFKDYIMWLIQQYKQLKPEQYLETGLSSAEEEERRKEIGKRIAAERRAQLLANMTRQQQDFRTINEALFEPEVLDNPSPSTGVEDVEMIPEDSVALGPNQTPVTPAEEFHKCIVCQDEQEVAKCSSVFVLVGYVQLSTVHAFDRKFLVDCAKRDPITLEPSTRYKTRDPIVLPADLQQAVHFGSCGHEMHLACWTKHFEGVLSKERHRPYRQPATFDVEEKEFLCPLCYRLSNCVLPITPPLSSIAEHEDIGKTLGFVEWVNHLYFLLRHTHERANNPLHTKTGVGSYARSESNTWYLNVEAMERDYKYQLQETTKSKMWPVFRPLSASRIPPNLMETISGFQSAIYELNPGPTNDIPYVPDPRKTSRSVLGLWQTLAYTILSSEINHRHQGIPFFGKDVKTSQAVAMTYLVRAAGLPLNYPSKESVDVVNSIACKLLGTLLSAGPNHSTRLPTEYLSNTDAFSLLVSLTFAVPQLFAQRSDEAQAPNYGRTEDYYLMKSMLVLHVGQVITQFNTENISPRVWYRKKPTKVAEAGIRPYNNFAKCFMLFMCTDAIEETGNPNMWTNVYGLIIEAITPFLRCCCKFYECLTGIQPRRLFSRDAKYTDMLAYLGLPTTANELFSDDIRLSDLVVRWEAQFTGSQVERTVRGWDNLVPTMKYPRNAPQLVDLPEDYMDLINSVSSFTCQNSESCQESRMPTMCLVCGAILCSQSYCCQKEVKGNTVGACTYHSYICGAGIGIFLRIRDCKVFYLGGKLKVKTTPTRAGRSFFDQDNLLKGIYVAPPYLDEYGESDPGLRRGNPMKLDVEKYEHLRQLWMNHQIQADIASYSERSTTVVTTEWQYL